MERTADIERYYAGCAILDALERLTREADAQMLAHTLKMLGELAYDTDKPADDITAEFLKGVLELSGTALDFGHCNLCKCELDETAFFSDKDGVVCKHCKSFDDIAVENAYRAYINGEKPDTPHALKAQANILLANLVYRMLGVKLNTRYFTELI